MPLNVEKQPLLVAHAATSHDDEELVCGVGKKIGVKAESMGFVVVEPVAQKSTQISRPPTALQQWGAVALGLLEAMAGHKPKHRPKGKAKKTPSPDSSCQRAQI